MRPPAAGPEAGPAAAAGMFTSRAAQRGRARRPGLVFRCRPWRRNPAMRARPGGTDSVAAVQRGGRQPRGLVKFQRPLPCRRKLGCFGRIQAQAMAWETLVAGQVRPLSSTRPGRRSARRSRAAVGCSAPAASPQLDEQSGAEQQFRVAVPGGRRIGPVWRQAWADRSLAGSTAASSSGRQGSCQVAPAASASSPSSRMNRAVPAIERKVARPARLLRAARPGAAVVAGHRAAQALAAGSPGGPAPPG